MLAIGKKVMGVRW